MSPLVNYKSIRFAANVNHVAQERCDGCGVKQARRCETPIANRDKYTVTISGVPTASAKSYTEKESVSYPL